MPRAITASPVPATIFDAHDAMAPSTSRGHAGPSSPSYATQLERRGRHAEPAWLPGVSHEDAGTPPHSHATQLQRRGDHAALSWPHGMSHGEAGTSSASQATQLVFHGEHDELAWLDDVSHRLVGTASASRALRLGGEREELAWLDEMTTSAQSREPLPDPARHTVIRELPPGGARSWRCNTALAFVASASLRSWAVILLI